ncbi:MAG TPA: UDP-glucose/GDP-mannose dehydrogenase family protein [Saprospiraceae bacterium]|nr:UDP-glucose/GDP-mannose dehydrogenase family protein [Saprospiraceae bacterium]HRV87430.1 UDP-glucose/GDP-mannose dehydrogenase family protein [Saprospiraceae bacterium]
MRISVIGTGYVGLVTGTCFAETGNQVVCVDVDAEKVARMRQGEIPIYEPGLDVLFERNIEQNRLHFTTSLEEGIRHGSIIFLALPTPPGADGSADLSALLHVAEAMIPFIDTYKVIVDKSTVPVGTADQVKELMSQKLSTDLFDIVSNPEFLREGAAVDDFMKPDRVVIGIDSERAKKRMDTLYQPFVRQGNPILYMDIRSAEMTKYAANAYLATRISFMNEIANICEQVGANVDHVRRGIGTDTRIGKRFLFPGVGYGGSCFPKDVQALARIAESSGYHFSILSAVMEVNQNQRERFAGKIINYFGSKIDGTTIAIWGLAFKPNTDDIREAPALSIIDRLLNYGVRIQAYDPEAMEHVRKRYKDRIQLADSAYQALEGADALVVITEWNAFRTPDFERMESLMKGKVVFDGRNVFDPDEMFSLGYHYESIGRSENLNLNKTT